MTNIAILARHISAILPRRLLATFLLSSSLMATAVAQGSVIDSSTPPGLAPGAPAGSYGLSDLENINLFNGHLNFRLPLLKMGGRGSVGYTVLLALERKWIVRHAPWEFGVFEFPSDVSLLSAPSYSPGRMEIRQGGSAITCTYQGPPFGVTDTHYASTLTRLTFKAPDGTEFELRDQLTGGRPLTPTWAVCMGGTPVYPQRGNVFVTADGTAATFISDTPIHDAVNESFGVIAGVSGYLILRDGTRYRIDNNRVSWVRDRNGNKVIFTYQQPFGPLTAITDSLNRQVTIAGNDQYDEITYKGFGGATRTIRVHHTALSQALRADYTPQQALSLDQLFPELNPFDTSLYDTRVISSVELPDGRRYRFYYNHYGELARAELPTGGAIEYDHTPGSGVVGTEIIRSVIARRVYTNGGTGSSFDGQTTYHYNINLQANMTKVVVNQLNPSGALLSRERHYFYGTIWDSFGLLPISYPRWKEGKEYQTERLDTNDPSSPEGGTVLRRVLRTWQQRAPVSWWPWPGAPCTSQDCAPPNDPRVIETLTTLMETNQVAKKTFSYDQYNNQTDVYENDFGVGAPGPLIRRIHIDYVTLNNGVDYAADTNIHIRNMPLRKQVFDAGGTKRAETFYEYDLYDNSPNHAPLIDRPGISGLDSGFTTGYTTRGNVTRTSSALLNNSGGVTSWVNSHAQYDIAGNVVKVIDANGNAATFDFSDRFGSPDDDAQSNAGAPELGGGFTYAFPTKVSNDLDHTAYTQYDYYLGSPVNSEDANGVISSVTYNDVLDRPTQGIQARFKVGSGSLTEKSQMTVNYDDTNHVITTTGDLNTFGDNVLTAKSFYDGLGRKWRSAAREGSTWTITDTQFDALGRVSQVSNPYRAADPGSASPPSDLWTTTEYDELGRAIRVTTPDGAHVDTTYNGNQVMVIDQAGKKRRSETDALGRSIEVTEAPDGLNYKTTYLYDALGNLRKVTQGAQTRWFAYDSLSRIIRARNPEQNCNTNLPPHTDPFTGGNCWSTAYSYNANGNLTQRTDARGVVANYTYDPLNRNTGIDYINGSQTRSVEIVYDGATNGKGRLRYERTIEGGVNSTETKINSYDALGRPLNKQQSFWGGSDWGTPFVTEHLYDLAGNVKTLRYPSGRTVDYSHDQAGRLSGFSGNLGGGASVNYADMIKYDAAGQMLKERFGTNLRLFHNSHYNNRLQLASTRLGDSATDELNWSRGAFDFFYGTTAVASGNQFANDTDNNGNLRRQITYVPLAGGGNVIPQQHDYTYDALNRIATVRERQRNGSGQWSDSASQAFGYDRWGNRWLDLSGGVGEEMVWFDDSLPAGAVPAASGGDSWNWVSSSPAPKSGSVSHISNIADWSNWSPPPYSGNVSHQSNISSGFHQHQYFSSPTNIPVRSGGTLYAYIYIDPENIPQQVMLQWGTNTDGWEHRAYWGANMIGVGTDGTPSRRYMGPLPPAGGWVRLEVPASAVGLEGKTVGAMAFTLYGGRANWDLAGISGVHVWQEQRCDWNGQDFDCYWVTHQIPENYVLVDDSIPAGSTPGADGGDSWNWRGANNVDMVHQHYFYNASNTLQVNAGDKLFTWVYLDPANPPSEVMLQWNENGSWEHRAYWGANKIGWGVDGTASRRYMGPLPQAGGWVKLEIPASAVGLEGKIVNGMAFTLYGGRAAWDMAGKVGPPPLAGAGPPINNRVYTVDAATNRLTSVNGVAMSYDAAGNQTNDGNGQLVYDGENRLVEAYNTAGVRVSWYVYDAAGRRVVRTVGSQGTWQVYGCGGELLAEYAVGASPSTPQKEYGYRNGQLLVVWDGSETGDRQLQWLVQDHLGSTRMVVDRSGNPGGIRRHDFAPFGEELFDGVGIRNASIGYSVDSVRQKFTGHERDSETGLDFAQARYFASLQGRFTSPDSVSGVLSNPQSLNLYAYVYNNPLAFVDPSGHVPIEHGADPLTSTHTDRDGNVVAVYEDGDHGVYRHDDLSRWDQISILPRTGAGVTWMGVTEIWHEFRAHHDRTGAIEPNVAEGARIIFETSFDQDIERLNRDSWNRSLADVARESHNGQTYDIKVNTTIAPHGANTGRLLNGKYATARAAGDYLAGMNGATGRLFDGYISETTMMKLAGALHKRQFTTWNAGRILYFGKSFGPAPWYGEIEYAGKNIQAGFRRGVSFRPQIVGPQPIRCPKC